MALSGTACHSWDLEWLPTQHPSVLAKFLRRGLPGLLADAKSEHASLPGEVTSTVQELRWSTPALGGPCSSWCWPSETQESSDPLFGQRVFSLRFGLARLRSQPIAFSGARLFSRHLDVRFVFFCGIEHLQAFALFERALRGPLLLTLHMFVVEHAAICKELMPGGFQSRR